MFAKVARGDSAGPSLRSATSPSLIPHRRVSEHGSLPSGHSANICRSNGDGADFGEDCLVFVLARRSSGHGAPVVRVGGALVVLRALHQTDVLATLRAEMGLKGALLVVGARIADLVVLDRLQVQLWSQSVRRIALRHGLLAACDQLGDGEGRPLDLLGGRGRLMLVVASGDVATTRRRTGPYCGRWALETGIH